MAQELQEAKIKTNYVLHKSQCPVDLKNVTSEELMQIQKYF